MHLPDVLLDIVFPHGSVAAELAEKRLDRGVNLDVFIESHRIVEDFVTGMARVGTGRVVVMIDVVIQFDFVREEFATLVTNARSA